jgi:hypothetical protein
MYGSSKIAVETIVCDLRKPGIVSNEPIKQ